MSTIDRQSTYCSYHEAQQKLNGSDPTTSITLSRYNILLSTFGSRYCTILLHFPNRAATCLQIKPQNEPENCFTRTGIVT
jgi:hypothetical protein